MKGSTILVGLDNYKCRNHDCSAYFLSGDILIILIKHYGIVGTAESRIMLLRFPKFLRQLHIHELRYYLDLW